MENFTEDALIKAVEQLSTTVNTILLHIDSLEQLRILKSLPEESNLIISTSDKEVFDKASAVVENVLFTISKHPSRIGEFKHATIFATLAGLLKKDDKIICISSSARKGSLDLLAILDLSEEVQTLSSSDIAKLVERMPLEVIESVMHIAVELVEEGREGLNIGTIFVFGDCKEVEKYARQLILNPFKGYDKVDRNIVDLSIKETVKNFSMLDGAFIIDSDGTIISAGTYLDVQSGLVKLPKGLGARHRAASAITSKTKAIAIVVSHSGAIRIFKDGNIILEVEKR